MDQQEPLFDSTPQHPGEHLRQLLEKKGATQEELAAIAGIGRQQINDIISGRSGITPETALALGIALGTAPAYWMKLDTDYRLTKVRTDVDSIRRAVKIFELAPIKKMQRRGWIKTTKDINELENELKVFFDADSLDRPPEFPLVARKGNPLSELTPLQRVWCFRARKIARALHVKPFDINRMGALQRELRILAAYPAEASRVSELMRDHGIRFVVVEPLPGSKMDGAAFWFDENSPVIAVSLISDRIDNFWFTVLHECAHIKNRDSLSVDTDLAVEGRVQPLMKEEIERKADQEAAAVLIPPEELDSFIRRIGPLYAKPNIIQFAHRIKIHPGIIVGQLQHRAEMGFGANREMLPKIRQHVISTALTDGWGNDIAPDTI